MKYISWNKITKVSLTGLLICGATLCEKAQAEENNNYSGVTENLINTTVDVDPPEFVSLVSDKTEVKEDKKPVSKEELRIGGGKIPNEKGVHIGGGKLTAPEKK